VSSFLYIHGEIYRDFEKSDLLNLTNSYNSIVNILRHKHHGIPQNTLNHPDPEVNNIARGSLLGYERRYEIHSLFLQIRLFWWTYLTPTSSRSRSNRQTLQWMLFLNHHMTYWRTKLLVTGSLEGSPVVVMKTIPEDCSPPRYDSSAPTGMFLGVGFVEFPRGGAGSFNSLGSMQQATRSLAVDP